MKILVETPSARFSYWAYRAILLACGVLFPIALVEGILRVQDTQSPKNPFFNDGIIPDSKLVFRLKPGFAETDTQGFRNSSVPAAADIVAVGDSQTYGNNATEAQAWPQQLSRLLKKKVYNMAVGGYGPVQYHYLLERAATLHPRVAIVAYYTGNDLYDSYHAVYETDAWQELRSGEFQDRMHHSAQHFERIDFATVAEHEFVERASYELNHGWLNRSHLYRRLFASHHSFLAAQRWAQAYPDRGAVFESRQAKTVLTPAYRLLALNLADPRIAEGLRIATSLLPRIASASARSGATPIIFLLPTKEMVYARLMEGRAIPDSYRKLIQYETAVRTELIAACARAGIAYLDPLPALQSAAADSRHIYPDNSDGHPSPDGYQLLATVMYEYLRSGVAER
jgi:lysophospholipase L1-like esterase